MRISCFALALILALCNPTSAQESQRLSFYPANEAMLQNYSAEFPSIGASYSFMRSQIMQESTERLLRDSPAAPGTFEMLVYMERWQQAAVVLHRLIQSAPSLLERPFELLLSRNPFRSRSKADGDVPLPALIA